MKNIQIVLLILCIGIVFQSPVVGAQATSRVTVRVCGIDQLRVTDATRGIILELDGLPGSDLLAGNADDTARLRYIHNSAHNKKITAEVNPENTPSGNHDISLMVEIPGGLGQQVIVSAGDAQGAKVVLTAIKAGQYKDLQIIYNATATATRSVTGDYEFRVTFTSLEDN